MSDVIGYHISILHLSNVTVHWNEFFLSALLDNFPAVPNERFAALQRQWMGCFSSIYLTVYRESLPSEIIVV